MKYQKAFDIFIQLKRDDQAIIIDMLEDIIQTEDAAIEFAFFIGIIVGTLLCDIAMWWAVR